MSHVVLEGGDVVLEAQRDVAQLGSGQFEGKIEKKREPCRIGSVRCRVGGPMRRGSTRKLAF